MLFRLNNINLATILNARLVNSTELDKVWNKSNCKGKTKKCVRNHVNSRNKFGNFGELVLSCLNLLNIPRVLFYIPREYQVEVLLQSLSIMEHYQKRCRAEKYFEVV